MIPGAKVEKILIKHISQTPYVSLVSITCSLSVSKKTFISRALFAREGPSSVELSSTLLFNSSADDAFSMTSVLGGEINP